MVIPREVKKVVTHSRELRKLRESVALTAAQRETVIGTMLGDGSLIPNSWGKSFRLHIEHGLQQKEYVFRKYRELKSFVLSRPTYFKRNHSWKFRTISHWDFTNLEHQFYGASRRKMVSKEIVEALKSPKVIAIWYMDDGGIGKRQGKTYCAYFNSQSFSWAENEMLGKALLELHGIETLILRNHDLPRIYIPHLALTKLSDLVRPYIIPCMRYKIL